MDIHRAGWLVIALVSTTWLGLGCCCGGMKAMTAEELADLKPTKLQERCDKEDFLACQVLGDFYIYGEAEPDMAEVQALYERACEGELADSCMAAGFIHAGAEDYGQANPRFQQGCDMGAGAGCYLAGLFVLQGEVQGDLADGVKLVERGCDLGHQEACDFLQQQGTASMSTHSPSPECAGTSDCTKLGMCTYERGRCVVGGAGDCQQSELCHKTGACMAVLDRYGVTACKASSDEDCQQSENCRTKGACIEQDGWCVEGGASDSQAREDMLKQVRTLLHDLAEACEDTKAESKAVLRGRFSDPGEVWGDPFADPAYSDFVQPVLQYRMETLPAFQAVEDMIRSNQDLLGDDCNSALSEAATKAREDCFYDGSKKNVSWLRTAGQAECE